MPPTELLSEMLHDVVAWAGALRDTLTIHRTDLLNPHGSLHEFGDPTLIGSAASERPVSTSCAR